MSKEALGKRDEKRKARRKLIVEVAAMCFIDKGFHQTSIRDIAQRADISLGNLYNHFESKAELIAEISMLEADELAQLQSEIHKIKSPEMALKRFSQLYLSYCSQRENAVLGAEIVAEGLRNPKIGEGFIENRLKLVAFVAKIITRIDEDADCTEKMSAERRAECVCDLIEGLSMRCGFAQTTPQKDDIAALDAAIWQIIWLKQLD